MTLVLNNGDWVEITRMTCGYIGRSSPNIQLNSHPVTLLDEHNRGIIQGAFVVGDVWKGEYDKYIPFSSVSYIDNVNDGSWK